MKAPNLFSFATSELSQDAFIAWFLSRGKSEYEAADPQLHLCARRFLSMLFSLKVNEKTNLKLPDEINTMTVTRQVNGIDVLCTINGEYAIIIEDKTWTNEHSDQLERYYKFAEELGYNRNKIIAIFYKTEDRSDYGKVVTAGYYPVIRKDIIAVLEGYKGDNNILLDYVAHLKNKENAVESYIYTPVEQWKHCCWVGFYQYLQSEWKKGTWRKVVNPSGGFMGFYWHFTDIEGGKVYLQIEETRLCFKLSADDDANRKALRTKWHKLIMQSRKNIAPELAVSRPTRFGSGKYMTIGVVDDFIVKKDSLLDSVKTPEILQQVKQILDAAISISGEETCE